jgi:hypothetical protein
VNTIMKIPNATKAKNFLTAEMLRGSRFSGRSFRLFHGGSKVVRKAEMFLRCTLSQAVLWGR